MAASPDNLLGPSPGTFAALVFDEADDEMQDYEPSSGYGSDEDEVDNCGKHSAFVPCTCGADGKGRSMCEKHMEGLRCSCGIDGREDVDADMMDLAVGISGRAPQWADGLDARSYFTRSKAAEEDVGSVDDNLDCRARQMLWWRLQSFSRSWRRGRWSLYRGWRG